MNKVVPAIALLCWPMPSLAASIFVESTSEDPVGQSIVYELRNEISNSARHKLVYTRDDAGFVIEIVTLKENDGRTSAYSASLLMPPFDKKGFDYFITSQVGMCGQSVTKSCAEGIMSGFDQSISDVVTGMSEALKPKH